MPEPNPHPFTQPGEIIARQEKRHQADQAEITRLSTDAVTGLEVRLIFDDSLRAEIERNPGNLTLVFFDLDNLKTINDTQGHQAGDAYIHTAAQGVNGELRTETKEGWEPREHDEVSVYRFGGDEIVAILRGERVDEPATIEAIIARVQGELKNLNVETSAGYAIHRPGQTAEEIIEAASRSMEAQKRARKREKYTSQQLETIKVIGDMATQSGITIRDVDSLYNPEE